MTAPTVAPWAFTSSAPPVSVRSAAGILTMVSMVSSFLSSDVARGHRVAARLDVLDGVRAERAVTTRRDLAPPRRERLCIEGEERAEDVFAFEDRERKVGLRSADDADHR